MGRKSKLLTVIGYLDIQSAPQNFAAEVDIVVEASVITFADLSKARYKFLAQWNFYCLHQMYFIDQQTEWVEITENFRYPISRLPKDENPNGTFRMFIRSLTKIMREQYTREIGFLKDEIASIRQAMQIQTKKQQLRYQKTSSMTEMNLRPSESTKKTSYANGELDIGFLFSEPIFDEETKKAVGAPVGFRTQIKKLKHALKSGQVQQVNIKAEIATPSSLQFMINNSKPKILHISCHGEKSGDLRFEDDLIDNLGTMCKMNPAKLGQYLKSHKGNLPKLAFVNSCYSQKMGRALCELGIKYTIAINSNDWIKDEAAGIFSEHIYRNIFRGQTVPNAFKSAKEKVEHSYHSTHTCCCFHPQGDHKDGCKWLKILKENPNAHQIYHVPPSQCTCRFRNQNKHSFDCVWAFRTMYAINQDFYFQQNSQRRIPKVKSEFKKFLFEDDTLIICCCLELGKKPHSESQKFKIIRSQGDEVDEPIYEIKQGYLSNVIPEIMDYSPPQFQHVNQILPKEMFGREQDLYNFFKFLKEYPDQNVIVLTGDSGAGKSTFILKAASYMFQRRATSGFFTVDLNGESDPEVFRYKFNQATGMSFNGSKIKVKLKEKNFTIIFDNCDHYITEQVHQFYKDIKILSTCLRESKIILVMQKSVHVDYFTDSELPNMKFPLGHLNYYSVTQAIFNKIKFKLAPSVTFATLSRIVQQNSKMRNPKAISSICQSILTSSKMNNQNKKSFTLQDIKKRINNVGEDGNKLIKDNLDKIREKQKFSFQLLIFIAQFSEGISLSDLNKFSLYYREDSKFIFPVRKDYWIQDLAKLARNFKVTFDTNDIFNSNETQPHFFNSTSYESHQIKEEKQLQLQIDSHNTERSFDGNYQQNWNFEMQESYFLAKIGPDKISVPKYLRDFIRNQYDQETTKKMSYIFVSYICVMLELLFGILRNEHYYHEQIFNYSALSMSGVFSRKTNLQAFYDKSISESADRAREMQRELEKIIYQNRNFHNRIKVSDPSVFILNHKQDFLNIYNLDWLKIYQYLNDLEKSEHKIFLCFLSNLLIHIPSVLRFVQVQLSFQKNLVVKSINLLKKMKQLLHPGDRYIEIYFKLSMMKVQCQMDEETPNKEKIENIFTDLEYTISISPQKLTIKQKIIYQLVKWEKKHSLMYLDYSTFKDQTKNLEKIKTSMKDWTDCHQEKLLGAKHAILLCQMYYSFFTGDSYDVTGSNKFLKMKHKFQKEMNTKFIQLANKSYQDCKIKKAYKLALTARLIQLELIWELEIQKGSTKSSTGDQHYQESLNQCKMLLDDCQKLFLDKKYKIAGFSEFQQRISNLTKKINNKFWQNSRNTIIFMRAVPISRGSTPIKPIVPNLVRKSHNFRKQIEGIIKEKHESKQKASSNSPFRFPEIRDYNTSNKAIGVSVKFQILTREKLKKQLSSYGPSLLILTTNAYVEQVQLEEQMEEVVQDMNESRQINIKQNIYLIVEDELMGEQKILIDKNFEAEFKLDRLSILIVIGENSKKVIRKLKQILERAPIMIALDEQPESKRVDTAEEKYIQAILSSKDKKNAAELSYIKEFISRLHNKKITQAQELQKIHNECCFNNLIESKIKTDFIDNSYYKLEDEGYKQKQNKLHIDLRQGNFRNLSPDISNYYNVLMDTNTDLKDNQSFFVIRRWEYLRSTLSYIFTERQNGKPACVNIFGDKKSGKTYFAQQLVRIMVQRQYFSGGVFFIKGDEVQKKYGGDFYKYILKESEKGKLPQLNYFFKPSLHEKQIMFVIDDFDHINQRSTMIEENFLQQVAKLKLNIILVSNNSYFDKRFCLMRNVRLKSMTELEINVLAYNVIEEWTPELLLDFQELKSKMKHKVTVRDLQTLVKKHRKNYPFSIPNAFRTWSDGSQIATEKYLKLSEARKQKKKLKHNQSEIKKQIMKEEKTELIDSNQFTQSQ